MSGATIGTCYTSRALRLSTERVLAFSGGPFRLEAWPARNLHTDPAKAAEAGLSAPIASGLQAQSHLVGLLQRLFSDAWFRDGELDVRFRRQVHVGDTIVARARIVGLHEDGAEIVYEFDVSCERGDGEAVVVGSAKCRVRKSHALPLELP